ncbi:MAG: hypothetical protein ACYST3_10180, partial [Planctomycetota bacterium]
MWNITKNAADPTAFVWDLTGRSEPEAYQWNPCLGDFLGATFDNGNDDNSELIPDPLTSELTLDYTGSLRVVYYFAEGAAFCREEAFILMVNGNPVSTGVVNDLSSGKYVYFDVSGLDGVSTIQLDVSNTRSTTCDDKPTFRNTVLSGVFISNCADTSLGCRFTGGGVDTDGNWDHTLEDGEMIRNGSGNLPEGIDRAQFGGQAGAHTALPPQPAGEWTHHQQKGPSGDFTFHCGTSSAPEGS